MHLYLAYRMGPGTRVIRGCGMRCASLMCLLYHSEHFLLTRNRPFLQALDLDPLLAILQQLEHDTAAIALTGEEIEHFAAVDFKEG